jgi:prepilin-type N-terminal cleavage/methylation domain-containing protein
VSDRRGFTLVELVMVIVLTLILTSVSIKGLNGISAWRSAAAVQRVQADVLYARNHALLSMRRTLCVFDPNSHTYEIQQEATPASGAIAAALIDHPATSAPWQITLSDLSSGLAISAAPTPTFGFGTDGLPVDASGTRIGSDISVTFSNGAILTVQAGSGLSEVSWP